MYRSIYSSVLISLEIWSSIGNRKNSVSLWVIDLNVISSSCLPPAKCNSFQFLCVTLCQVWRTFEKNERNKKHKKRKEMTKNSSVLSNLCRPLVREFTKVTCVRNFVLIIWKLPVVHLLEVRTWVPALLGCCFPWLSKLIIEITCLYMKQLWHCRMTHNL